MPSRVPMNRLSFRIIYGVTLPFPNPVFQCPGEGARISPGLGEAIARYRSGEPQVSLPVCAWSSFTPRARVSAQLRSSSRSCWGTSPACPVAGPSTSPKDLWGDRGRSEGELGCSPWAKQLLSCRIPWARAIGLQPHSFPFFTFSYFKLKSLWQKVTPPVQQTHRCSTQRLFRQGPAAQL